MFKTYIYIYHINTINISNYIILNIILNYIKLQLLLYYIKLQLLNYIRLHIYHMIIL